MVLGINPPGKKTRNPKLNPFSRAFFSWQVDKNATEKIQQTKIQNLIRSIALEETTKNYYVGNETYK